MKPVFISMSLGGISNKLKTLISCQRLANKHGGKVLVYWPKTKTCFASFSDLFQNNIEEIHKENLRKILKGNNYKYHNDNVSIFRGNNKRYQIFSGSNLIFDESDVEKIGLKKTDLSFKRLPVHIEKEYITYFKQLVPSEEVNKKLNRFMKKNNDASYIGVHIRRGDFLDSGDDITEISPLSEFNKKIKK